MLAALGSLATQQANPTQNTMKKVKQLLDDAATHPDAIVTYNASDMVLAAHSNASFLSESNARSRAGGHYFMSSDTNTPHNNGAVMTISHIIKAVLSSAAEAEVGALFINCREAVPASPGTQTTTHSYANRQYDGIRSCHSKCDEKIKIDGHEIPLAPVPNQSRTIPTLLESR